MREFLKPYRDILRCEPLLLNAAASACRDEEESFTALSAFVTAPVLFGYVWWVLKKAMGCGIQQLYFLARDGYVMYRIALLLCDRFDLPLQCHYFCTSRYTLRMAAYCFRDASAYDLLFLHCAAMTPEHLLLRGGLTAAERAMIYTALDFPAEQANRPMSHAEFDSFCAQLRQCALFDEFVMEHSGAANRRFATYCRQAGMFAHEQIGIVDTGWTGSMQFTLSRIFEHLGEHVQMTGFYFGLYSVPAGMNRNDYYPFYFSPEGALPRMVKFNNNLFECMCAAPHGMTMDYRADETGKMCPVFSSDSSVARNAAAVREQLAVVQTFSTCLTQEMQRFESFTTASVRQWTEQLLQRVMVQPDKEAARAYGSFVFCDDISEAYHQKLAAPVPPEQLRAYLVHRRLLARLRRKRGKAAPCTDLFWSYGSLALSGVSHPAWYRLNIYLWDLLRYRIDHMKHKK